MSVVITGKYLGEKRVESTHSLSGVNLVTDAPKDNNGLGRSFSPTDLIATALGSCVLTTIAIVADRHGLDITGSHFEVEKIMNEAPRRIGRLPLVIHLPISVPEHERSRLERAGLSCPVHHSLLSDIPTEIRFLWDV